MNFHCFQTFIKNKVIILFSILFFIYSICLFAQSQPNVNKSLTPEEQSLVNAQRLNAEAQAEYYRESTNKLRQPTPTPTPKKTFSENIAENPTAFISVIGTMLVAGGTLLALFFNNRNTLKTQTDAQDAQRETLFYEASKRLGDDSVTIRANAAGLLAQKAQTTRYYISARDQLLTALSSETDLTVLESISVAIEQFISSDPEIIATALYAENKKIQVQLSYACAEFHVIDNLHLLSGDIKETLNALKQPNHPSWVEIENSTVYNRLPLSSFAKVNKAFDNRFMAYFKSYQLNPSINMNKGAALASVQDNLKIISKRLQLNTLLFWKALAKRNPESKTGNLFPSSFLAVGDKFEQSANLTKINLSGSMLNDLLFSGQDMMGAKFSYADLSGAGLSEVNLLGGDLTGAIIEGANLKNAILTDTKLAWAKINDDSEFKGSNWWQADFYLQGIQGEVDTNLLEKLHEKYKDDISNHVDKLHNSVLIFYRDKTA